RARDLRLFGADLLRFQRLHRHRTRERILPGLPAATQLRGAVFLGEHRRVLAPLAHDPIALAARLSVHPARRQPAWPRAHLPQPDPHDAARRALARRQLDIRDLGPAAWAGAGRPSLSARAAWRPRRSAARGGPAVALALDRRDV